MNAFQQDQKSALDHLSDSEIRRIIKFTQDAYDKMDPDQQKAYDRGFNAFEGSYGLAIQHFTPGGGENKNLGY